MTPYNKCTVLKSFYAQWPDHKIVIQKSCQKPLNNDQVNRVYTTTIPIYYLISNEIIYT